LTLIATNNFHMNSITVMLRIFINWCRNHDHVSGRALNVKKLHPVSPHFLYVAGASSDKQVLIII
jgi:hypothetical protein